GILLPATRITDVHTVARVHSSGNLNSGSLYCPGYHGTLYADLAGLKLKFLLTSSSKHKGTKVEGYRTVVLNLWVTAPTGTPRSTRKTHISGGLRD
ncbi:hypothetical protein LEMLEM_LOCUS17821, partial [Lemmus lemmus]